MATTFMSFRQKQIPILKKKCGHFSSSNGAIVYVCMSDLLELSFCIFPGILYSQASAENETAVSWTIVVIINLQGLAKAGNIQQWERVPGRQFHV